MFMIRLLNLGLNKFSCRAIIGVFLYPLLVFAVCSSAFSAPTADNNVMLLKQSTDFMVDLYGHPTVNIDDKELVVSAEKTAGLLFTYALNPAKKYSLQIDGKVLKGSASIRLSSGDSLYTWFAFGDKAFDKVIGGKEKLQILIYSDQPFSYALKHIALKQCDSCTDPQLLTSQLKKSNDKVLTDKFSVTYLQDLSAYNQPTLESKGNNIYLSGVQSAGLFFNYALNPDKKYTVQIDAKMLNGKANLRLSSSAGRYSWFPLENKPIKTVVSGQKKLQLLIYSDKPFATDLVGVKITPCHSCTDPQLLTSRLKKTGDKVLADKFSATYLQGLSAYNQPELEFKDNDILITSSQKQSGLYFNYILNPAKRYRLTAGGYSKSGQLLFTVQSDQSPAIWLKSAMLADGVTISNSKKLSILVFGSDKSGIKLSRLSLSLCPACKTNQDLKQLITSQMPELAEQTKRQPLQAAKLLLKWASNSLIFSLLNYKVSTLESTPLYHAYYDYFGKKEGGVYCGGSAVYFNMILHLFGMQSFTIDIGLPETHFTHVTTVLAIKSKTGYRYYIFDPTFGLVFLDKKTGNYATVSQMMNAVKNNDFVKLIEVKRLGISKRLYIGSKHDPGPGKSFLKVGSDKSTAYYKYVGNDFYRGFIADTPSSFKPRGTLPNDSLIIRMLMYHVFSISSASSLPEQDFLKLLKEYKISYGKLTQ